MAKKEQGNVLVKEPKKPNKKEGGAVEQDLGSKVEQFVKKNTQAVLIGAGAIILIAGYLLVRSQIIIPEKESEAQQEIFYAQRYFEADSFKLAINGDGNHPGFLDIAEDYSGTKAAELSHYYLGISYLKLGDYDAAIEYLKEFNANDVYLVAEAYSGIGDAYAEKGNMDQAIEYYKKAAGHKPNELLTPYYLMKTGQALESVGRLDEAKKYYDELKQKYPLSTEGREIDKYIARVESKLRSGSNS